MIANLTTAQINSVATLLRTFPTEEIAVVHIIAILNTHLDVTKPSVPTNLVATPVSGTQINLTWTASTDTNGSGVANYKVTRGTTVVGSPTGTSFSDTGLTPSTAYTYKVRAVDNRTNESNDSSPVTATTQGTGAVSTFYGNPFNFGDLFNTTLDGATMYSNRIMFPRAGQITSVRKYHMFDNQGGYSAGTGGTVKYELRTDDGSSNNFPTSTVLGSAAAVPGNTPVFPNVTFTAPITVSANTWYHLVTYNTASNPTANYTSMNDFWDGNKPGKVRNPVYEDKQLAVLRKFGASWTTRPSFTAIVDFTYSDGSHFGCGYMERSSTTAGGGNGHDVSGANKVRQTFTFSPTTSMPVSALNVALWRVSGTSAITATLTSTQGTVTATNNSAPVGGYGDSYAQYNSGFVTFSMPTTLVPGVTYQLELSAPSNTVYRVHPARDGNAAGYGFGTGSVFNDGFIQYSTNNGSTWLNWDTWGDPSQDMDMAFYFA